MRLSLTAILLLSFCASCDNTDDLFLSQNEKPSLVVSFNDTPVTDFRDSIKIGFPLSFSYTIYDEESLPLSLSNPEGGLDYSILGNSFTVSSSTVGNQRLIARVNDSFNHSTTITLNLISFHNLAPISQFTLFKVADRELEVDARTSYDKDSRFGGFLLEYEYDINGYIFKSNLSLIRYIFNSSGQKKIRVRVRDNSDTWSDWIEEFISI